MRIVCGTDFSIHANSTATAAASLAARLELPLTLVHVVDPARYTNPSRDLMDHLRGGRQKKMQVLAERAGHKGVIVETAILQGPPAQKLAEFAAGSQARLLAISARGQIAPTQWLAGSVTDQTVQISPTPTLILRNAGSFESWLHGDAALNILIGYDYSAGADAAIRWVKSLASIAPCDITIAYVASPANDRSRLGIAAPWSRLDYPSALRNFLEMEIRQNCAPVLGDNIRIFVKADWGRTASQVIQMAADEGTDLLVVGTSQRRGLARFGSVARAVVHYAEMNVASVPEGWAAPGSDDGQSNGLATGLRARSEVPRLNCAKIFGAGLN